MKKIIAIASLSAFIAAPALADDRASFYVAMDTGVVVLSNAGTFPNLSSASFTGGYHFSPNLAIEAGTFATYDDSPMVSETGRQVSEQKVFGVSAVGTYPLNKYFDLFGKFGWNTITTSQTLNRLTGPTSSSATTTNLTYGLGAQYNISAHFGIRVQYESLGKSKLDSAATGADTSRSTIGVVYNF
jgi:opacity protein-like surface antigen